MSYDGTVNEIMIIIIIFKFSDDLKCGSMNVGH